MNFKNIINFDEQVEVNLELKEVKLKENDIFQVLIKEVKQLKEICSNKDIYSEKIINELKRENENKCNELEKKILLLEKKIIENEDKMNELKKVYEQKYKELKTNNDILLEEYNKKKEKEKEEENRKKEEEKIEELRKKEEKEKEELQKKEAEKIEEIRKKEEENLNKLNDNVHLINNFKFDNYDQLKSINLIWEDNISYLEFAVYCIIKNNERLYEIAYGKRGFINIYNLILNRKENKILAHSERITIIKHYFNSYTKNHILLSSSKDKSIKLWNISSNPIINFLIINECYESRYIYYFYSCLMFKDEKFFIFGFGEFEEWSREKAIRKKIKKIKYGIKMEH